jgi:hypothetical protein
MATDALRKGIRGRSSSIVREPCSLTIKKTLPKGVLALQTASCVVLPCGRRGKRARHASQSEFRSLRGKLARSSGQ